MAVTKKKGTGSRGRASHPSVFERLGRSVVRRPWHYLVFWLVLMALCLPAVANLGSVFTNSMSNPLPSSDASVVAQSKLASEFPNASGPPSSSLLLLVGPNITGPDGQNATWAMTQAIQGDSRIQYLGGVETLYTAYAGYLSLQAGLGLGALGPALHSSPSLPASINGTASLVWGPAAAYAQTWAAVAHGLPNGTSPSQANWPAYQQTRALLNASPSSLVVLSAFYYGNNGTIPGFNQTVTSACLTSYNVVPCADTALRATFPLVLPALFPNPALQALPLRVVQGLSIENMSSWGSVQWVGASYLGNQMGLPAGWMLRLWDTFPNGTATSTQIMGWTLGLTQQLPVSRFPLPLPAELRQSFVNPANNASLLIVTFTKPDNYTRAGRTPVFDDLGYINKDATRALASSPAFAGLAYYQTGSAPLDNALSYYATSSLGLLLVVTVVLLVVIMIAYFRAPAAPLVTFTGIGISIFVTLAGLFVAGTFVTHFASLLESILLVFLMAIVTDYSIFMMARYREELVEGHTSQEAVVASVQWAGQSITTSGLTVFVVALALTFSGLGFLSQLGIALAIAVIVAVLMALTVIPALLRLIGPRVFWPYTGDRFGRHAEQRREHVRAGRTYFSRAGLLATRRPVLIVVIILLLSVPVTYLALNVPVSYNLTDTGMPTSDPAQKGFIVYQQEFGESAVSSSFVLATFSQPLLANGSVNAQEFRDVAALTVLMNSTSGISDVSSVTGPGGATLPLWLNYSHLPVATRTNLLLSSQSFIGVDGRTVQFSVSTTSNGYSEAAATAFGKLENRVHSFQGSHPELETLYYGGAAQGTHDYQALTNQAMEGMLIGVSIGIFVVLLVILGAAFVPALALGAIGLSIVWSWATVYFVVSRLEGITLSFLLPLILIILVLGLGMDYNALFLTRVKEERLREKDPSKAIGRAVTHAGGVITAAAVILGGPFLVLGLTSSLGLVAAIGLGIGMATLLQAFVAQTYLTPAILTLGRDRIWWGPGAKKRSKKTKDPPLTPNDAPSKE